MTGDNESVEVSADELASLGEQIGDDAPPAPATPEPEKKAEPAPEPEPEKKPEPAKPEADDDEDGDDDEAEDLTLDEITERVNQAVAKALKADAEEAEDDRPEAEKLLAAENARLKAEAEAAKKELAEKDDKEAVKELKHAIASTSGKYKMTTEQVNGVIQYMKANEDLVAGGMKFEEAALRRFPQLADRLRTSPDPRTPPDGEARADGLIVAPGSSGPGAPKPFKPTPGRGEYGDITKHSLESGEAAQLGSYT